MPALKEKEEGTLPARSATKPTTKNAPLMATNRHQSIRFFLRGDAGHGTQDFPPSSAHTYAMQTAPTHTIPVRLFELHHGDKTTHDSDSDTIVGDDDVSANIYSAGGGIDRYELASVDGAAME